MAKERKKLPAVRFFSKVSRHTGYGQAGKNFIITLSDSKIRAKFDMKGSERVIGRPIKSYDGPTGIDIYLHGPPYNMHTSRNYKIGYFYWEANVLPRQWRRPIHTLNEIWAPCELIGSACKRAGFKGPIEIVPTPSTFSLPDKDIGIPSPVSSDYLISNDVFKFYSIFQWHERKGFKELLKAYLTEFSRKDRVMLILKVMPLGVSKYKKENIRIDIINLKRRLNLKEYPLVYLIDETLPLEDIYALHKYSDCYVSAHHGEGWGMPIHDAMSSGNHLITTKFGGVTEYLDEDSAHIIKHTMGKVKNMGWSKLYDSDQSWAYPSVSHLKGLMRDVYENSNNYKDKTYKAKDIADSMSTDGVGEVIENILSHRRFSRFL